MPEVRPENIEAVNVFAICKDQVILGVRGFAAPMGGMMINSYPYAIRNDAVIDAMRLNRVQDKKGCLGKVKIMFDEYRTAIMDREDAQS